jgi:type II secretory ATPase GspE/PulE/Tfp pilus assembly ATPase PilB-like protein
VNFVFGKEQVPQFELNLMLAREIISSVKTAAGLDAESQKELQRGMMSASFRGMETALEVRSQGFFGGERMYVIKIAQKPEEKKK